jgi:hypothetical protein
MNVIKYYNLEPYEHRLKEFKDAICHAIEQKKFKEVNNLMFDMELYFMSLGFNKPIATGIIAEYVFNVPPNRVGAIIIGKDGIKITEYPIR